jgi:hypothetical protein
VRHIRVQCPRTLEWGKSNVKKLQVISVLILGFVFASAALAKDSKSPTTPAAAASSNASSQFDQLKQLAGEWISRSATDQMDVTRHTYRIVSNGSAVMLTTEVPNEGPMITMFYLDGPRLMATHFCGAKNQPRYVAVNSSDPNAVVFKFKDATNLTSPQMAHMSGVTFKFGDSDHHTQQWTFTENGKSTTETFSLERSR